MSNLNLGPKEGDIDGDGRRYVYGKWWNPWVIPLGRENKIMPLPDYDIELQCYKSLTFQKDIPPGVESRGSHFKKTVNHIWGDPDGIWYFEWNPNADRLLEAKLKHKFLTVAGHGGSGKCLAPNTPVLMFDGTVRAAKDVRVGDQLMGDDSSPRSVIVTNPGRSNMVRIVPTRGEPWECNDDHILVLKRTWAGKKSKGLRGTIVEMTVKDYLNTSSVFKSQHFQFGARVDFPDSPVEFSPRAYGIWLGDGTTGGSAITSSDSEVAVNAWMKGYFEGLGYSVKRAVYGKQTCPLWLISTKRNSPNPFLEFVRESSGYVGLKQKGKKRILRRYLINSREKRMELLAGIIDADGHAANGTYFEIACSLKGLTDDIAFLARSLGFQVTVKLRNVKCNGKSFPSYRINILGDTWEIPALRKKCRKAATPFYKNCTPFKVEQLGEGNWSGFMVDGNGRFLLGDCTVTHNSEFGVAWMGINYLIDPRDTKGLITSLTLKSARGKIWGSMSEAWQQLERFRRKVFNIPDGIKAPSIVPGKLLAQGMIRYEYQGVSTDKAGIELIPGDTDKAKESAEKVQGYHRGHIIAILDELASLDHALMKTVENNLFTNWDCDVLGLFNPDSYFDPGGKYSTPIDGFGSLKGDEDGWATPWGYCVNLRGSRSPNVVAKAKVWRGLMTYEAYTEKLSKVGPDDKEFCKMFEGRFSAGGTVDCIYDEGTIINSMADKPVDPTLWVEKPTPVGFFDPSFAHGGDRAILYKGRLGRIKLPGAAGTLKVLDMSGEKQPDGTYAAPYVRLDLNLDTSKGKDEQIVDHLINELKTANITPENLGMDVGGAGISLFTILSFRLPGANRILQLNFGESASDLPYSATDKTPCKEKFARLVSEIWYQAKPLIRSGQVRGLHPDLIVEMVSRRYETRAGKIMVESKEDMKKRTLKSPDIGDSGLGLVHLCRLRLGLQCVDRVQSGTAGTKAVSSQRELAKKVNAFNGGSTVKSSRGAILWNR